jgi:hypothetical protein
MPMNKRRNKARSGGGAIRDRIVMERHRAGQAEVR